MPGRTSRDQRRRRLGQNFLHDAAIADEFVSQALLRPGELVVEFGAGVGALTDALARHPVRLVCVELDRDWVQRLRRRAREEGWEHVRVEHGDFLTFALPRTPFRVVGNLPFGATTAILRRLLDDPSSTLTRLDAIVQWEVARKRARAPASTLLSATWAPWWEFQLGRRIPATRFRPRPRVDGGVLSVTRRDPPLLPSGLAAAYAGFVRDHWPGLADPPRSGRGSLA